MSSAPVTKNEGALSSAQRVRRNFRPEIQALRALAVGSVVLYHLWGNRLHGGFLGVDVFFVISGFLITAHLLRDADRGSLHLPRFWARRIRRLMPASLLVLLVTGIAVVLWVPTSMWQQFLNEIIASAFYVENWALVANSVDYLALDNVASPVQHFWSLSTEEQFYVIWPIAIALTLLVARVARARAGARGTRIALAAVLGVITVASFVTAIVMVPANPDGAFFATTTRAWEFGAGSLLAFVPAGSVVGRIPEWLRSILSWLAWVVLIAEMFLFTAATPHPSFPTLVPVLATVAIIWLGSPTPKWSPTTITSLWPVQRLGDISYSLYLWHWPLIIVLPYYTEHSLRTGEKLAIIVVALVLAILSYRFVEAPTRVITLTTKRGSTWRWFAFLVVAALVVAALPTTSLQVQAAQAAQQEQVNKTFQEQHPECYGAAAMLDVAGCAPLLADYTAISPLPSEAGRDVLAGTGGCQAQLDESAIATCFDHAGTAMKVLVVGDSHASHITPWVYPLAKKYGWDVTLATKGRCPWSAAERVVPESALQTTCVAWNQNIDDYIAKNHFDLIITSQVSGSEFAATAGRTADEAAVDGLVTQWSKAVATGARIVVVKDNPRARNGLQSCISGVTDNDYTACGQDEDTARKYDPQPDAVAKLGSDQVFLLELDEFYCADGFCPAVTGGVNVYRDTSHLTATFAATLEPYADQRIPDAFKKKS